MIRDIHPGDMEVGISLMHAAKCESSVYSGFDLREDTAAQALAFYCRPDDRTYARCETKDGQIVGFLLASLDVSPWIDVLVAEIDMFYVLPEVRGHGYGVRLMLDFMQWRQLQDAEVTKFSPWGGIDDEETAQLVEKLGFRQVGRNYLMTH